LDGATGQNLQAREQRLGLGAAVRLDEADDDVDALLLQPLRARQHGVSLADAGRRADEDQQPPALAGCRQRQQSVGIRTQIVSFVRHLRRFDPRRRAPSRHYDFWRLGAIWISTLSRKESTRIGFLMLSLCASPSFAMECLRRLAPNGGAENRRSLP